MSMAGSKRIGRETKTIRAMVDIYCHDQHGTHDCLCPECTQLFDYAVSRLARCVFANDKPTCANCPIHCYKPDMRARAREIMRYAGPRMLKKHPILAMRHLIDGRNKTKD